MNSNKLLALALGVIFLVGCRGSEETDAVTPNFPVTPDQDTFAAFLNQSPGTPRGGAVAAGSVDNVNDFPEAYYNTIDPGTNKTRDTFAKWKQANGFEDADGNTLPCELPNCIATHVKFRDTKDLGYGRNMFMRQSIDAFNSDTKDIAIYVENFQVDAVPGVPYGPLNLEALVNNDRTWNFGVNAIEFSAYPDTSSDGRKFTKFYNFAGDGKRADDASGLQQHIVDLDGRGTKPMPMPCIACHGGAGRTVVYQTQAGEKRLAPTITGGIPGDLQAQMQTIEFDTLQFADAGGFRREDNEDGIRLINSAILSSYEYRRDNFDRRGDWDADTAIETLVGRYGGNISNPANRYDSSFVPAGWSDNQSLYRELVGPNCMVCHALRGKDVNNLIGFGSKESLERFGSRIDQLVFEHGKMPAGLLNYSNFWDSSNKDPFELANTLQLSNRIADQRAIRPGAPVAVIAAPVIVTGISNDGSAYDVPITGSGSAFSTLTDHAWTVEPPSAGTVTNDGMRGDAILRATRAGPLTLSLTVNGVHGGSSTASQAVTILRDGESTELPAPESLSFYGNNGILALLNDESLDEGSCVSCHNSEGLYPGIPLYYEPCQSADINGYDFLYRSVLARVNFDSPLDSLFLRKPSNGASDPANPSSTTIEGYHAGGYAISNDVNYNKVLAWILNGAPQGENPTDSIAATQPQCTP